MPYDKGVRITQAEYISRKQAREGREQQYFKTGPNGANPGSAVVIDEETAQPVVADKAGSKRSKTSKKTTSAAIADALGVTELPDLTEETE